MSGETQTAAAGGPAPAGWGVPSFLPPAVARRAARDDAREAREAAAAERERELRTEELHSRALALYVEQAEQRGEVVTAMQLARGEVRGRSVQDILAAASAAADRADVITAARLHRDGHGDPEPLHVEFGEPQLLAPAARSATSATGRAIATRARKFSDLLKARKALAEAERAAEASRNDYGFVCERRTREDGDPVVMVRPDGPRQRRAARDDGLRFR